MITPRITRTIHDILIGGAGVSGTGAGYSFTFSNARKVLLLEKYSDVALVNSNADYNAETSHDGSTETNYSLAHALEVLRSAVALRRYLVGKGINTDLYQKRLRMVLGIGGEEIHRLLKRFDEFKPYYPDIELADASMLAEMEPMVIKGRNPFQEVLAIYSREGFIVNYQELAREMFKDTVKLNPDFNYSFNTPIQKIEPRDDHYVVHTPIGRFFSRVVLLEAGAYSLFFARELGYGMNYAILPVAGSFYSAGNLLKNKIYRVQEEDMPFAEIHADPNIKDMSETRFGPTTKPLPLMERHHYNTFRDFMSLPLASSAHGIATLVKIVNDKHLWGYAAKNFIYDMPIIGPAAFLEKARQIIPSLRYSDLKRLPGAGGIRPQIVNLKTQKLEMGDKTIVGKNIIFNTTPSPGASVCLGNGHRDAVRTIEFLGPGFHFDEERFQGELGPIQTIPAVQ